MVGCNDCCRFYKITDFFIRVKYDSLDKLSQDTVVIIDTINYKEKQIIVFDDKTWEFTEVLNKLNHLKSTSDSSIILKYF